MIPLWTSTCIRSAFLPFHSARAIDPGEIVEVVDLP